MSQMRVGMIPWITDDEIQGLVANLAKEIEMDYHGKSLVMICPLKGSVFFFSDLVRKINLPQEIDFVHVTSPKGEGCRILKDLTIDIQDKHVIIVEEIIDAGRTLSFLKSRINASHPASLKVCALLDKPARRELPISPDYVGKTIEDRFVIGYGMDSEEIGRNYKDIYNYAQ
ncbi:MAG: hypoxanthine phosphoribosyltransferase [Bdellovibrionales bacterium]|nr:hypoxanthine phosphoribosyltransferase [Bdellovibrionales bacterium]